MEEENKKQADSGESKKSLILKAKKVFKWLVIVFVLFNFVTFALARLYDYQQEQEELAYFAELERPYKEDSYGGDTPEETLQLFIDALKAGDTDLASKYFIPEKQEEMKGDLAAGIESGGVGLLLEVLEKEREGTELYQGAYQFNTYDEDNVAEFSFDLILNPFTHKWKIESL